MSLPSHDAAGRVRSAGVRVRQVATSDRGRRVLSTAAAASALGASTLAAAVVSSGRSPGRRGGAGLLGRLAAAAGAVLRRRRRRRRVRAAGRWLGVVATAPLHAAGDLASGAGRWARARPRPLTRKRRSKMAGNFKLAVGLAAGYVLGARAGRERYERLVEAARRVADRPEVQRLTGRVRSGLGAGMDKATNAASDRLERARASAGDRQGRPGERPEQPTERPGASTERPEASTEGTEPRSGRRERSRAGR